MDIEVESVACTGGGISVFIKIEDTESADYISELLTQDEALKLANKFFAAAEKLFSFANTERAK